MFRWLAYCLTVGAICVGISLYWFGVPGSQGVSASGNPNDSVGEVTKKRSSPGVEERQTAALDLPALERDPNEPEPAPNARPRYLIENGLLSVINSQNVSSDFDGKIFFIGTEITDETKLTPKDEVINQSVWFLGIRLGPNEITSEPVYSIKQRSGEKVEKVNYRRWKDTDPVDPKNLLVIRTQKKFRRLQEGDPVKKGEVLGLLDPTRIYNELAIKVNKLDASEAQYRATVKTRDEAEKRYQRNLEVYRKSPDGVSKDDMGMALLGWQKYIEETVKDFIGIDTARSELLQVESDLRLREFRSSIDGRVKAIYKNAGEPVKGLERQAETILQIQDPTKLAIEGQVDVQYARTLKPGDELIVEPFQKEPFQREMRGHMGSITGLAVSKDGRVVSVSDDGTGIVWDPATGKPQARLRHNSRDNKMEIRAVACTSPQSEQNWCLTGAVDGIARLWDMDMLAARPTRELSKGHTKPINCVAFSPNGRWCATGSDDNSVCVWDVETGDLKDSLRSHRARVTTVQFLADNQIVSAAADKTMLLWTLDDSGKPKNLNHFDTRSGDVAMLGVHPPTKQVLFDKGKELQVLSLPDGNFMGDLQNASRSMTFTTMALFSPDGQLVLTNDATRNYLQLWRAPNPKTRAYELCQLVYDKSPATCGAFDPNGKLIVTGTQSGLVLVWRMPVKEEIGRQLTAWVVNIDTGIEGDLNKVRVKAHIDNADGFLMPDGKVTMVAYPKK